MIRWTMFIKLIKANITHRLLRTFLTLIGIIVGVACVFSLVTVGQGLEASITAEFADIGSNRLIIEPQGNDASLTDDDVDAVEAVGGIQRVAPIGISVTTVSWAEESTIAIVAGLPPGDKGELARTTLGSSLAHGRGLPENAGGVAVVGHDYRYSEAFDEHRRVGQDVSLANTTFEVIGINEELGNTNDDRLVFIPLDQYQSLFDDETYQYVVAETPRGADVKPFIGDVERGLRSERDETVGEESFSVETVQDLVDSFTGILDAVQVVVISIAAISLLVGAIGVGNTMYTAVLERRRDIGVLKSIGAGRTDILLVFAGESMLLGFVGGVLGVVAGYGLSEGIVAVGSLFLPDQFISVSYSATLILWALAGSALLGLVAGAIPAYRAAKLQPVEALRTE